MADLFRLEVETILNPSSIQAYAREVESAMRRIEAYATSGGAGGGPAPKAEVAAATQSLQVATTVGARNLGLSGGGLGGGGGLEAIALEQAMGVSFAKLKQTYGIQLLEGEKLEAAVVRGSEVAQRAAAEQLVADEKRVLAAAAQERAVQADIAAANAASVSRSARGASLPSGAVYEAGGAGTAETADDAAIAQSRKAASIERERTARIGARAELAGVEAQEGETAEQLRIRTSLAEKEASVRRSVAIQRAIEANEGGIQDLLIEQKTLQLQNERSVRAAAREQAGGGAAGGGGALGALGIGGGAGGLLGIAAGAAGVYTGVQAVSAMVKEAQAAQVALAHVQVELEATGRADQFPKIRQDILDMSTASGLASDQVAGVAAIMLGAYHDVDTAIIATRASLTAMQVEGLNADQVKNLFVAIPAAFNLTGASIAGVNDQLLHLQDTFGVSVKETAEGIGSIGPLAAALGLSLKQTSTLVAAASAASGRQGSQVAGELGRALTQIEKQAIPILQLFQSNPKLAPVLPKVETEIGQGQSGQVLIDVVQHWKDLTHAQQENFLQLVGGRREFASLAALLGQSDRVMAELNDTSTHEGRTAQELAKFHETLAFQVDQAKEAFRQLGEALVRAGLGTTLSDLISVGALVVGMLQAVTDGFGIVNEATHGWAGRVLELVLALKALQLLANSSLITKLLGGFGAGGVAFINPVTATIAATAAVGVTYANQKSGADKAETSNAAAIAKLDDADLAAVAKKRSGILESFSHGLYGVDTVRKLAEKEQQTRRFSADAPQIGAVADDKGVQKQVEDAFGKDAFGRPIESFDKIMQAAKGGSKSAIDAIEKVLGKLRQDPGKAAQLDGAAAAAQAAAAKQSDAQKVESGQTVVEMDATRAAYQAGTVSFTQYLDALGKTIAAEEAVLAQGSQNKAVIDQHNKDLKEQSKALSDNARAATDDAIALRTEAGIQTPQQTASDLTALLQNPKFTDPTDRAKAAKDVVAAENKVAAEQANLADSAVEKLRILEQGVAIPPAVRVEELYNELNVLDTTWQNLFISITGSMEGGADLARKVAERSISEGIGQVQALREVIQGQIDDLRAKAAQFTGGSAGGSILGLVQNEDKQKGLQAQIDNLPPDLQNKDIPDTARTNEDQLAQARKAAATEAAAAAKKQYDEAKKTEKARRALRKAQLEGDPVGQAQVDIEEAQALIDEAQAAGNVADALTAQAQLVTAQHAAAKAQEQIADAYRNIDKALAQAAGDTVRVAQLEIAQAQEHLANAQSRGDILGGLQAQAELIAAQAGAVGNQISTTERNTDFLLQMQKITTGQAIAQLEGLLKIPGITAEQTQQLLLKIQSLRKGVQGDLNFDIPTDIKLPTLYEVRRSFAAQAQGTGYNDSRQININVTANNMTDVAAMATVFADQFSGPPRGGTTPRMY